MSKLLILITSVIDTPNLPLSYSQIRSVYNRDERYEQTQYTIETIENFFPEADIMMVECSNFDNHPEQLNYFKSKVKYFLNLWDRTELHPNIFGLSKALGEATQTIEAFNYLIQNNIQYENLVKISGRYYFLKRLDYDNDKIIAAINYENYYITIFFKLPFNYLSSYKDFLISNLNQMIQCCSYESIFTQFCELYTANVSKVYDLTYVYGKIAPTGYRLDINIK